MITDSFDNKSPAIINPDRGEDAVRVDACVITFSYKIEQYVLKKYAPKPVNRLRSVSGDVPLYIIERGGKRIAFCKTCVGAPATVGFMEDTLRIINCPKYILFGGAGCLDREIARGKLMVPTAAYRDEGTSYHYAPASDYIDIKNANVVAKFMEEKRLPYALGKTWTTDAFYRETRSNFEKRKSEGCISVEMECSAAQAMCDFRGLKFYVFFTSGDLLDAPEWDERGLNGEEGGQNDNRLFEIALALAEYVITDEKE